MQMTVMTPRRVMLLVPMAAAEHLVVRLTVGVELGHPRIEEAEVEDGHPETEGHAERRPRHREQQHDDDRGRAHDDGGHHRAPEHLRQCIAPEVRRARRACSRGAL